MRTMKWMAGLSALTLVCLAMADSRSQEKNKKDATEVVINIDGKGGKSKYIEEGKTMQEPVTVLVGQTVTWKNLSTAPHTATSDKKKDGDFVWKTKNPIEGKTGAKIDSDSVVFDQKMYAALGGMGGMDLTVDYHCEVHPPMMGRLILKMPAQKPNPAK